MKWPARDARPLVRSWNGGCTSSCVREEIRRETFVVNVSRTHAGSSLGSRNELPKEETHDGDGNQS